MRHKPNLQFGKAVERPQYVQRVVAVKHSCPKPKAPAQSQQSEHAILKGSKKTEGFTKSDMILPWYSWH
jgi:hypothetical protein